MRVKGKQGREHGRGKKRKNDEGKQGLWVRTCEYCRRDERVEAEGRKEGRRERDVT